MKAHLALLALVISLSHAVVAYGQLVGLADDIIVISKGVKNRADTRERTALGHQPGSGQQPFAYEPGGRGNLLEREADPAGSPVGRHSRSVLTAAARSPTAAHRSHSMTHARAVAMRQPPGMAARLPPLYGVLHVPGQQMDGPPNGMTLDQAIDRLLQASPDLRAKCYELPQARADVLTAGLRANPMYFLSANNLPYRPYSPGRFGAVQYSPSIIQPVDVNDKRGARVEAAAQVVYVLEAQYQDAVRLAVNDLYEAYADLLLARDTLSYAEARLAVTSALLEASREQAAPAGDSGLNVTIQAETARLDVDHARSDLLRARHRLGAMLAIPRQEASRIELRDLGRPPEIRLPDRDELVRMALDTRPDVRAYRLGIRRAKADAHLARKERFEDVFLVYSPFVFQNNVPIGKQSVTSFSLGVMGSVPIFDRKQGEIRRAETNVAQTRAATTAVEIEAAAEVESAAVEYDASRDAVKRIETTILPAAEQARTAAYQKYTAGRSGTTDYLVVLRDRNEVVRQYREALLRQRRSMLQLNTAVGRRMLP